MKFDEIKMLLEDALKYHDVPCSDIAISKDGEIVYRYMNGTSDDRKCIPINGDELYFLYSATKPITCTAALQLYEKGMIDLEDRVYDYVPEFKNVVVKNGSKTIPAQKTMKIKHLFTMTSGMNYDINHLLIKQKIEKYPNAKTIDVVKTMAEIPLEFEPGSHFKYSLSHDVLAAIIEIVTGMSFGEYLQNHIFDVCDMKNTFVGCSDQEKDRICSQYMYHEQENVTRCIKKDNPFIFTRYYQSGGAGLVSCVEDYMRFADKLINSEALLNRSTLDLMRASHISRTVYEDFQKVKQGYSYGLGVRTNVDGCFSAKGEFGWDGAAGAYVMLDPDNHIAVFYATHIRGKGNYLYNNLHPALRDATYRCLGLRK